MPRIARKRSAHERQVTIVLTFTGNVYAAYDAARRVLDAGTLQDAMIENTARAHFTITNAEIK